VILHLDLSLRSETCFSGSGGGRIGGVDVDLETDPGSGLPIARGRTLKGLLVEELALILRVLEPGGQGPWHATAAQLFGTPGQPGQAKLSFEDGRLPADLRAAIERHRWGRDEVLAALTAVRHQTKVDGKTGAPEPHSLRSTRLLRAGLRLRAAVRAREPLSVAEQALLAAATAAVRRAGLHRNHGWGEVELRLLDSALHDVTAAWLSGIRQPPGPPIATAPAPPTATPRAPAPARRVLSYHLTLTAPVVLATTGGDPGAVETRPYVSGAAVLGALASRWLAGPCADPALHPEFRRLFLNGTVRYLNAYPEGADGTRLLPRPHSLVENKGQCETQRRPAFDKANPEFAGLVASEPDTQWQPLTEELAFVRFRETELEEGLEHELRGRQPRLTPRLHHTRDNREAGRSTDGAMFSYIALEAGERLIGHVLCETGEDARTVHELLSAGPLSLGRSRTATYGGWTEVESLSETSGADWHEAPRRPAFSEEEKRWLVVTLLSDYLGVSRAGLPDPRAIEEEIGDALGITHSPVARFLGSRPVAGYVSHWRMPRPSHPALTAGSVLVYQDVAPDPERLRALCWQGIGTRRAEGYGRVAVHWHGALDLSAIKDTVNAPPADIPPAEPSSALLYLKRNLLRNALQGALIARAVADADRVGRPPSAALIARLRGRVRTATKPEEIRDFLARASLRPGDKGLKKAGQALARARLGQQALSDWLMAWMLPTEPGGEAGWTRCHEVTDEVRRLAIPLDLLTEPDRWLLLQAYLDAFCEKLRRRVVAARATG
jgi:CRISPR-associated protein Csx10